MAKPLLIIAESFGIGGMETYISGEIRALVGLGREVHLVCGKNFDPTMVPAAVTSVTSGLALGPEASIEELVVSVDVLRQIVREKGIGVIHAHPFTSLVSALACAELEALPLVITLHGPSSVMGSYGPAYDFVQSSLVLPKASVVLAVSEEIRRLAEPYAAPGRLRVQPNVVDTPAQKEVEVSGRWLLVSRFDKDKASGIETFVRAAHDAGIEGVDLCGAGVEQERLQALFDREFPAGFANCIGATADASALMPAYAGVAGMGRVVLEGLASERPVFLVGYDGLKGMMDEPLFRGAEICNFSGRGVPSLSRQQARDQLRAFVGGSRPDSKSLKAIMVRERSAEVVWGAFARKIDGLSPVAHGAIATLIEQLRVAPGDANASAFWSREVMDSLGAIVAALARHDSAMSASYGLYSSRFTRWSTEIMVAGVSQNLDALNAAQARLEVEISQIRQVQEALATLNDVESASGGSKLQQQVRESSDRARAELAHVHSDISQRLDLLTSTIEARIIEMLPRISQELQAQVRQMDARLSVEMGRLNAVLDHNAALGSQITDLNTDVSRLNDELTRVYSSASWIVTRPLRLLKRFIFHPVATSRYVLSRTGVRSRPNPNPNPNPGRFRRLVVSGGRFATRTLKQRRIDPMDRARLLSMFRRRRQSVAAQLGVQRTPLPQSTNANLPDVYVWAVIDWHFRIQRPQHLATALARKGHRVFYISNNFVDSASPGFVTEDLGCEGRLFQVNLNVVGMPQIYADMPTSQEVERISASLGELLAWTGSIRCMSFVQHPYWFEPARRLPNAQLIYDCMDHHGGFENNASSILQGERDLIKASDLLVVTSQWLYDELIADARNIALVRNATEYDHFSRAPASVFRDELGRKVIGYYGAIAEWFDAELVRRVALAHPDALVLLVGRDTVGVGAELADLANVRMTGEVPYADLPYWLYGFDVCLLPFKVIPLTLATNPVKVYEYLSAGKPVVSVDLPELAQFEGLVALAGDADSFVGEVDKVLADQTDGASSAERRREFAARQTWAHRAQALDDALESINEPRVSVIVLTYNKLDYTKACLESLERYSDYSNLEVIVVDNASSDGSQDYLREWASRGEGRRFIASEVNSGFSAGNNIGLAAASGDYLVILNNDTYVTPGWIRTMMAHLRRDSRIGLVGPVTNNIGNEAKIQIQYDDMAQMLQVAGAHTRKRVGKSFRLGTAAFFCVMLSRASYEAVGGLDEQFGIGFFEDDDYCRRLADKGFDIVCAEDVFVHHQLSASFGALDAGVRQALFEKNKAIYEQKWGEWKPHCYRQ